MAVFVPFRQAGPVAKPSRLRRLGGVASSLRASYSACSITSGRPFLTAFGKSDGERLGKPLPLDRYLTIEVWKLFAPRWTQ